MCNGGNLQQKLWKFYVISFLLCLHFTLILQYLVVLSHNTYYLYYIVVWIGMQRIIFICMCWLKTPLPLNHQLKWWQTPTSAFRCASSYNDSATNLVPATEIILYLPLDCPSLLNLKSTQINELCAIISKYWVINNIKIYWWYCY